MRKSFAARLGILGFFVIVSIFARAALAQNVSGTKKNNLNEESLPVTAQTDDAFDKKNELSVLGGFAPDMPRVFGGSRRSSFGFAAVRYSRRIATSENLALKLQVDFIPLALINYEQQRFVRVSPTVLGIERERATVYGIGLTPVSFQLNFRRRKKVQPFLNASAGMMRFAKSVPDDRSPVFPERRGRQFNFTLAGGGGIEYAAESARSYTLGFKFHHISNASTGNINPGFDQNLFYFGYTFSKF